MQTSVHAPSRSVYVTTRKVASQLLERMPDLTATWIEPKVLDQFQDHKFYVITRDPTERFWSMYRFLQEIYQDKGASAWDIDWIYREALSPQVYRDSFCSSDWKNLARIEHFVDHALPVLARTRDLHWRTQQDRVRQVFGNSNTPYTRIPLAQLNRWFATRHGITITRVNQNPSIIKPQLNHLMHRALDSRLRESVWREDYALHQG